MKTFTAILTHLLLALTSLSPVVLLVEARTAGIVTRQNCVDAKMIPEGEDPDAALAAGVDHGNSTLTADLVANGTTTELQARQGVYGVCVFFFFLS